MGRRTWIALGLAAAVGVVAFPARDAAPWRVVEGLLIVALVAVLLSGLAWGRWIPGLRPIPDLFQRPGRGERWCADCGRPTPRGRACAECGASGPSTAPRQKPDSK